MATSPHSNPEVAGSSLARSQCPYGSGFTPRLRLAGWRSARWDHLGGWEDRGISPPPTHPRAHTHTWKTVFSRGLFAACSRPISWHHLSKQHIFFYKPKQYFLRM
ncbi:hypothetical protein Hanom_Chr10g00883071 [Helianthus anomalus]